jgi:hypothetical protein
MIVIAASAAAMGALRFIIWATSVVGVYFLLSAALMATIKFAIPIALVAEFFLFAFFLWFRRKPAGDIGRTASRATLRPRQSGGRQGV